MRKIEIITDHEHLRALLGLFEDHRIAGFTAIEIAQGRGLKQGATADLGLAGAAGIYVMTVCRADEAAAIEPALRGFIREHRGVAFVSSVDVAIH